MINHGRFLTYLSNAGEKTNLTKEFQDTDRTIQKIRWKTYGPQKLFDTKVYILEHR